MFLSFFPTLSLAEKESNVLESQHFSFSIHSQNDVDLNQILRDFQVANLSDSYASGQSSDPKVILTEGMDEIVKNLTQILGLQISDFHTNIKIFDTQKDLDKELKGIFGVNEGEKAFFYNDEIGFFYHENNTIYLSLDNVTLGVLAHEVAHALISQYFVVPPPRQTQEILAGYAEFSLKKIANNSAGKYPLK